MYIGIHVYIYKHMYIYIYILCIYIFIHMFKQITPAAHCISCSIHAAKLQLQVLPCTVCIVKKTTSPRKDARCRKISSKISIILIMRLKHQAIEQC